MRTRLTQVIPFTETRHAWTGKMVWLQLLLQCATGCFGVALATFVAYRLHLPLSTAGFIYLLLVVLVSLLYGIWQATLVSLIAVSCLNFFFVAPVLTFIVSDSRDWIALISFQICALVVSRLSSREQTIAREATRQRTNMEKLYELSRGILLVDLHQPPGPQLVKIIRQTFSIDDIAIFDANVGRLDHAGKWTLQEQQVARDAYFLDKNSEDHEGRTTLRLIRSGVTSIGAMAIRGDIEPLTANAMASLVAITFERYRSYQNESRAETAHQGEQLRSAVLDAMAHAFKTPLTVICTASSGLLEMGALNEPQLELIGLIEEESESMKALCNRLLETAKLEATKVNLRSDDVVIPQLINEIVSDLSETLKGHPIELSFADQGTTVHGDRELLAMILTQYLDNAAKYSTPHTPIDIAVRENQSELLLSVHNLGMTIPMQDRELIFERFYRSKEAKERAAGAGVGLSIVKKAAEAHHGHVWVISAENEGTTFFLSLPRIQIGGR